MTPSAMTSQRMMPPKMLTRMPFTCGSEVMILKASVTFSFVAPPPTSRKLAGSRAVELDDVHRRHGEAGAVDHAADLAVERDVVEVELGGRELLGILLGLVAQRRGCPSGGRARCRRSPSWRRGSEGRRRVVTISGLISSISAVLLGEEPVEPVDRGRRTA